MMIKKRLDEGYMLRNTKFNVDDLYEEQSPEKSEMPEIGSLKLE
jgi:hypothetical protein